MADYSSTSVAIVGAGIGALSLALDLRRKGYHDFVLYERDDNVGGTWNANRYPGCRCDVGAILYSHSRHPNPNWKESHPPREDIQQYWIDLAEKQGLMSHIKFHHEYVRGVWNSETLSYDLTLKTPAGERRATHKILVSAIGGFSFPLFPNVPGLKDYKGKVIHTLEWPRELGVEELKGKEVMVVGNGCSGVQLVTALAQEPEIKVIGLAKSHHWLAPSPTPQGPHTTKFSPLRTWLHRIPPVLWLIRLLAYFRQEMIYLIIRPESKGLRKRIEKRIGIWMRSRAPEQLKDKIIPSFEYGAKRLIMDGGYLKALNKPNVTAVWDSLASVTKDEVLTTSGKTFSPDVLALAIGFDTTKGIDIIGRDGHAIVGDRSKTAQYLGAVAPGFPNSFSLLGTNTAPGHFSVVYHLECQAEYISECIVKMREYNVPVLEIKQSATDKYNKWLDERLEKSIWNQVRTYFRQDGGNGKIFTHFPGPGLLFWWINYSVKWNDYVGAESIARAQRTRRRTALLAFAVLVGAIVWRRTA